MKKNDAMNETRRTSDEAPLKDVIDRWLKAYRLDVKMKEMEIIDAWPEMMGKAVANRTRQLTIKNKTLYLKMDSAVMREELAYGKQVIIERINQKAGSQIITDVWFG
jgi:predicted nucleic acid-binding Zn ribbon protein